MSSMHPAIASPVLPDYNEEMYARLYSTHPQEVMDEEVLRFVLSEAGWQGDELEEAVDIAMCESDARWGVTGDGGSALGLFQIHWGYTDEYSCSDVLNGGFVGYGPYFECKDGYTGDPFNPIDNATMAKMIHDRNDEAGNGWGTWSCKRVLNEQD